MPPAVWLVASIAAIRGFPFPLSNNFRNGEDFAIELDFPLLSLQSRVQIAGGGEVSVDACILRGGDAVWEGDVGVGVALAKVGSIEVRFAGELATVS